MQIPSTLTLGWTLALTSLALCLILALWHRDRDNGLDLRDLVCDQGRLDEKKFVRLGTWIVSTWGFVYLIVEERFSEWYFVGYMAAWVGNAIIDRYVRDKSTVAQNPR